MKLNLIIKNLIVFVISLFVILLATELYYRYFNSQVLGNTGSLSYLKWEAKNVKLNSWGFRDKERTMKKTDPNIFRILVIGPSNVFGQGVTNIEERLSERLERLINQDPGAKRPVEVINLGTMTLDTLGTAVELVKNARASGLEFDSVVVYYAWNSIKNIPEIGQRYIQLKNQHSLEPNPVVDFIKKNSYAYDWLSTLSKDKVHKLDGKTYMEWHLDFYRDPKYFAQHIESIKDFKNLVDKSNASLYFLVVPVSNKPEERESTKGLAAHLINQLEAGGVAVADATKIYDGIAEMDIPVSRFDGHNKSKFYEVMAQKIIGRMKISEKSVF